jgi:hypothetical protein
MYAPFSLRQTTMFILVLVRFGKNVAMRFLNKNSNKRIVRNDSFRHFFLSILKNSSRRIKHKQNVINGAKDRPNL